MVLVGDNTNKGEKYNTTSSLRAPGVWRSKLEKTKHGLQMGDEWVEWNLIDKFGWSKAFEIQSNSSSILTGVSKSGDKLEIFELMQNAKNITKLNL